jgi:Xaa-Pro aminopeptidase
MLTADGCLARRFRLWDALPADYEWVLIADPRHVHYFSNFWVNPISFSTCERGLLLLERSGRATLVADNFTRRSAVADPFVDSELIGKWYDHKHSVMNRDHVLFAQLKSLRSTLHGARGLIESEWLPVMAADELELGPECRALEVGSIVRQLRRQKEPDEIALLSRCMQACDSGHAHALKVIRPGLTELDLYCEVQRTAEQAAGLASVVYGDFRAVNAEIPKRGGQPTNYALKDGDLFILDYSVMIGGYRSDFTNTLAVGEPDQNQIEIFETTKSALHAAEQSVRAGTRAADVYRAASQVLESVGHPPLVHHAGHGLGLAHPEAPILVPESDDVLLEGDVITIEPGLYIEGIGGVRLEHNLLVTASGSRRLNKHELRLR